MAFRLHPVSELIESGGENTFEDLVDKVCQHSLA